MSTVAVYLLLSSLTFGQAPTGVYSFAGTVRNSVTEAPLRNALVELDLVQGSSLGTNSNAAESEKPLSKRTISGADGGFLFNGLPAGRYFCSAHRPDFTPETESDETGAEFVVPRPSGARAIVIRLTPYGAIQGHVVNQFEEPLESVRVTVRPLLTRHGKITVAQPIGILTTDNFGHFLLTRVPPGRYYVKVTGRDGGTETYAGDRSYRYAPWESFEGIYFAGAPDRTSATPIEVAPGSTVQTDFRVDLKPAFGIRGKLDGLNASEPESVIFELLQGNEPGEPQRALLDRVTGEFEILDVLPGSYRVRATQGAIRGEAGVTVDAADVGNLSIGLTPGVTITGSTILFARPNSGAGATVGGGCEVELVGRRDGDSYYAQISKVGGQFTIPGVFPGEYEVLIRCYGGYPRAARFGTLDLLSNPIVQISGAAAPPMEIELQQQGGSLKATLARELPPTAGVLAVPSSNTLTGSSVACLVPRDASHEVMLQDLAPGDYSVYGLSKCNDAEFREAEFLQSLSDGTIVRIEDGKSTSVRITRTSK
jgi:hypothetical protein